MMRIRQAAWTAGLGLLFGLFTAGHAQVEAPKVLGGKVDGQPASQMMRRWLIHQADASMERWRQRYEKLETERDVLAYQRRQRHFMIDALGGFPQRTPLNARVVGRVAMNGYRVEKVIFESRPGHFVTAACFLPDPEKYKAPYPGVLVPCGHSSNGKANDGYQRVSALLALHGMAALVFDPIDQGERAQWLQDDGKPALASTRGHTMSGVGAILLGRNTATNEIWDGMRGIDYLISRDDVDPKRIGCTGNSGGGTQTAYLMALDERIVAAAPSCYITSFSRQSRAPQDAEQNLFGQIAHGLDHADYLLMRAPKPTLICAATQDFFNIAGTWETYRYAKRLFGRIGYAERVDLAENDDKHGFKRPLREAAVRWMARWLRGVDEPIVEPDDLEVLTDAQIQCTPGGQVMKLEDAVSVYDLHRARAKRLAEQRETAQAVQSPEDWLKSVRGLAAIRPLDQMPEPKVISLNEARDWNGLRVQPIAVRTEPGIVVPALIFLPEKPQPGITLYVHEDGKSADLEPAGPVRRLVAAGRTVVSLDLRGIGETRPAIQKYGHPHFGADAQDVYLAYLLGRSYVGFRATDLIAAARLFVRDFRTPDAPPHVDLIAVGNTGVAALHAAVLEKHLFGHVTIRRTLRSWQHVVDAGLHRNQLVTAVHGALRAYDLPDLAQRLEGRLAIEEPADAMGRPVVSP